MGKKQKIANIPICKRAIADFHIHSTESDGIYSPKELITQIAASKRLRTCAITDHATTKAFDKVETLREWYDIEVIPGIEISTEDYKSFHFLGLGMTDRNPIDTAFAQITNSNELQLLRIVSRLQEEHGIDLGKEFINKMIVTKTLSRQNIAAELARLGYVKTQAQGYAEFTGPGGSADAETIKSTAANAIDFIHRSGGIAIWAHPNTTRHRDTRKKLSQIEFEAVTDQLVKCGLDGIECFPPSYSKPESRDFFKAQVANYPHLISTGGSDMHGNRKDLYEQLGNPHLKQHHVDDVLNAIKNANEAIKD